jgi:photosystem II stability/assembly factor-like uncharacterized protein
MKRSILFLTFSVLSICLKAQNPNWEVINTGYLLPAPVPRFIVKNKSIYCYDDFASTLIRSKNRGLTWDSIPVPSDSSQHLYSDIVFVNDSVGYVTGYDGGVFSGSGVRSVVKKTIDYGTTWQVVNNGIKDSCLFSHINFFDASNGIVFGTGKGRTQRFKTHDGGASWSYVNDLHPYEIDLPSTNNSDFFADGAVAIGFTNGFKVAVTNDGGSTWITKSHPNSVAPTTLDFLDKSNGVFAVNDSVFFTNDGASTFSSKRRMVGSQKIRDLAMIDMQKGFFVGINAIYYTGDGGNTWELSHSPVSHPVSWIEISGIEIFATTLGSKNILKLNIASLEGLNELTQTDGGVKIYPNPVSNKMNIQMDPGQEIKGLSILDALGREVRRFNPIDIQNISVQGLDEGLYTVELNTSTNMYHQKIIVKR